MLVYFHSNTITFKWSNRADIWVWRCRDTAVHAVEWSFLIERSMVRQLAIGTTSKRKRPNLFSRTIRQSKSDDAGAIELQEECSCVPGLVVFVWQFIVSLASVRHRQSCVVFIGRRHGALQIDDTLALVCILDWLLAANHRHLLTHPILLVLLYFLNFYIEWTRDGQYQTTMQSLTRAWNSISMHVVFF